VQHPLRARPPSSAATGSVLPAFWLQSHSASNGGGAFLCRVLTDPKARRAAGCKGPFLCRWSLKRQALRCRGDSEEVREQGVCGERLSRAVHAVPLGQLQSQGGRSLDGPLCEGPPHGEALLPFRSSLLKPIEGNISARILYLYNNVDAEIR